MSKVEYRRLESIFGRKNRYLKRDNRKQCSLRLSCAQVKN